MKAAVTIALREVKDLFRSRRSLFSIIAFAAVWGFIALPKIYGPGVLRGGMQENLFFYLITLLSAYSAFILSTTAFIGEKKNGRIRTLFCSPVTVRQYTAGKTAGVAIQAYGIGVAVSVMIAAVMGLLSRSFYVPSFQFILYVFIVLPVLTAGFTGLIALFQLFMGLRETRIFNIILMIILFGGLGAASTALGGGEVLSWTALGIFAAAAAALAAIAAALTRFVDKERIVTSVD